MVSFNTAIRTKLIRENMRNFEDLQIAVAGTGYVGLSIATLLAQHHKVTAVDIIPEKVEKINNRISPIQDEYIEKYFAEKELNLTATLDGASAYKDADFVVIAAPTNYLQMANVVSSVCCSLLNSFERVRHSKTISGLHVSSLVIQR